MSKENRPSFLFYASDWLSGTADLTLEEKGIFIDMLAQQWLRGDLPNDMEKLCRMFGGNANRNAIASILHKFRISENEGRIVLQNEKLERVRIESKEREENRSRTNSENAKSGWDKRRAKKQDSTLFDSDNSTKEGKKENATRNAIAMQMEDEDIDRNEDENRNENRGVQGGKKPRESFSNHVENFISAYGGIKGGNRRAIELAYIDAVNTLNSEGHSDAAAHELLAIQAARDREYCKRASQTRNNTQNWLTKRLWEKDYDQELKMWQETSQKTGGNSHGKSKSITAKIIEFNKHTGI